MEDTIALIKAISYLAWPICLFLIVFIFRKEIRTLLLSLISRKEVEQKPADDEPSEAPTSVPKPPRPDKPPYHPPTGKLPLDDQLTIKACKNKAGDYFVVLDADENDEKIYSVTPDGDTKWIERKFLQTIEDVSADLLGKEQLEKLYILMQNAEPDEVGFGTVREPLISGYLPSYIRLLGKPHTEPSRMLAYIKSKGTVSWSETKDFLHNEYNYEINTSGSLGASLKALEALGLVKISGKGDDKIIKG
jgi:hypothetical protein